MQPNNLYHGGIAFDSNGGVYYTTTQGFGGISYYNLIGPQTGNYSAPGANPIRGGITTQGGNVYGVAGTQAFTIHYPQMNPTPLPLTTPAPIPNGSAMAYDTSNNALWYTSGSNLVEYPVLGLAPTIVPLGVAADAGLTLDSSSNVWFVDNVNNDVCQYSGPLACYTLEPGRSAVRHPCVRKSNIRHRSRFHAGDPRVGQQREHPAADSGTGRRDSVVHDGR